ncbi:MAG: S-formylglutathione hydrolase [bacterium]|nr:S-formylglutathione hydrolase [bacterium]
MSINTKSQHKSFGGIQGIYTHFSSSVMGEMEFSVYMPPQADFATVPVLTYLSGLTCTQDNVTTKGGFQRMAAELCMAIVCPDTSPRGNGYPGEDDDYDFGLGAGFYVDATREPWSASYKMYSYVVDELPNLISEHFPVDLSKAGIFGHSMGGHGALVIGLKNPDKYQSVSAFSPIVAPSRVPWGQKAFKGYLGGDLEAWKSYDATELVRSGYKANSKILIDQGLDDTFLDTQLQPELFEEVCKGAEQKVEIRLHEGYDHSYYFISTFMEDHLRHHAQLLQIA